MLDNKKQALKKGGHLVLKDFHVEKESEYELVVEGISGAVVIICDAKNGLIPISGVNLEKTDDGKWVIKGTPDESTGDSGIDFTLTVYEAANSRNSFDVTVTIIVSDALAINNDLPPCMQGIPYSFELIAADKLNGATLSLKDGDLLPDGLSVKGNMITGTPAKDVSSEVVFEFILSSKDKNNIEDLHSLQIKQVPAMQLTNEHPPSIYIGDTYEYKPNVIGGSREYVLSIGAEDVTKLAPIVFSSTDKKFSGVLKESKAAEIKVTLNITDAKYKMFSLKKELIFSTMVGPAITKVKPQGNTLEPYIVGKSYKGTTSATGGHPPLTYSLEPEIPGLSINSSGVISGSIDPEIKGQELKTKVVVKDSSSTPKELKFDVIIPIVRSLSAPILDVAVNSNQSSLKVYMLRYLGSAGSNVDKIQLVDEKGVIQNKITGPLGSASITEDVVILYEPTQGAKGLHTVNYIISNKAFKDTGKIDFEISPELHAANIKVDGKPEELLHIDLSSQGVGGPFDSALTYSDFTSKTSYCDVRKTDGKIYLDYKIPGEGFKGSVIHIKYALTNGMNSSQLAKIEIKLKKA